MTKISVFRNAKNIKATREMCFFDLCKVMQNNLIPQLQTYRENLYNSILTDATGESYKTQIPAFTYAGTFSERNDKSIKTPSNILILDIDNISDMEIVPKTNILTEVQKYIIQKKRLERLQTVNKLKSEIIANEQLSGLLASVFVSPSENGLKVAFMVEFGTNQYDYKRIYEYVASFFSDATGIPIVSEKKAFGIDAKCSNISRLCFISFDEAIFINKNVEFLALHLEDIKVVSQNMVKSVPAIQLNYVSTGTYTTNVNDNDKFEQALKGYQNKHNDSFFSGNRQNFIFRFSCVLCRYGMDCTTSINLLINKFSESDFDTKEIETTCRKAYKTASSEFGKYQFAKRISA